MKQLKWDAPESYELMLQYRFYREFPLGRMDPSVNSEITPELRKEAEENPRIDLDEGREYLFDFSDHFEASYIKGRYDDMSSMKRPDPLEGPDHRHYGIKGFGDDHWHGYYFTGHREKHSLSYAKYVEKHYKANAREIWDLNRWATVGLDLIMQTHYGNVIWDFPKTVRRPIKAALIPAFYWEVLRQPPYDGT